MKKTNLRNTKTKGKIVSEMNLKSNVGMESGLKLEKHVWRREKGQRVVVTVGIRIKNILFYVLCFT